MDLSIIYVNWNALDYLRESITSVYRHTHSVEFEVIVVDNASPEPGVECLNQLFPDVKVIQSNKNLGFAGANNVGFSKSTGEYLLFLNPDTTLIDSSIDTLVDRTRSLPDAGIVGCKLLNTDLTIQSSSIQTYPTILNQAVDAEYLRLRWPECRLWKLGPLFIDNVPFQKVEVIPGACMMMRRGVFEQVGMFSEDYFMYAEDLDLNFKIKAAGFNNYFVGEAAIVHHGGGSSSRRGVSHWATLMKYRAMLKLFRKTRGRMYAFGYRLAMGVVACGRVLLLAVCLLVEKLVRHEDSLRFSLEKWKTVLKWAIGLQDMAVLIEN